MARFHLRGNLIPLCFIGILLFVAVSTAEVEEEVEKKIAKRDATYYSPPAAYPTPAYPTTAGYPTPSYPAPMGYPTPQYAPPATYAEPYPVYAAPPTYAVPEYPVYAAPQPSYYPSYSSYCAPDAPATQPAECDSNDLPLSTDPSKRKNCTCTKNACPAGATVRFCTSADTNSIGCTTFTCICNGPSASPNYCINVLPYPETAVVPYTPTPGGGSGGQVTNQQAALNSVKMQALIAEAKQEQLMHALGASTNSQDKLSQALALAKLHQQQNNILDSTSSTDKLAQALALAKLHQQQNKILDSTSSTDKIAQAIRIAQLSQENQLENPNIASVMQVVQADQLPHKQIFAMVSPQSDSSQTNDDRQSADSQGSSGLLGGVLGGIL